jgi:uncharacterized protein (TIGR02001 family)
MNKLKQLAVAALLAIATPQIALAEEKAKLIPGDLTFTATLANDYRFRGISQTDRNIAAQVGIDWAYMFQPEIGIYLGVWGSNVDFDDGDEANVEVDIIGGIKGTVWEKFSYQLGFIEYLYPKARVGGDRYNYFELGGKLGYDFGFLTLTGGVNYSPDFFFSTGDAWWKYAEVSIPITFVKLPFDLAINGHIGHQSIQKNSRFGAPDYWEWMIGLAVKIDGFTISASYVDTDIGKSKCFAGTGLQKTCGAGALVSVSKTF